MIFCLIFIMIKFKNNALRKKAKYINNNINLH